MKQKSLYYLLISIVFILFSIRYSCAQEDDKMKTNIRFNFSVPHPLANGALKKSFIGIFDLATSFNIGYKGLVFGGLYKFTKLQIVANKIAGLNTNQNTQCAALKVGYDYNISEKTIFAISGNIGYNWISYTRVERKTQIPYDLKLNPINIEPELNIYFLVDPGFAIGVNTSYNFVDYVFNPESICLNEFTSYEANQKKGLTGILNFGFSALYQFPRKNN